MKLFITVLSLTSLFAFSQAALAIEAEYNERSGRFVEYDSRGRSVCTALVDCSGANESPVCYIKVSRNGSEAEIFGNARMTDENVYVYGARQVANSEEDDNGGWGFFSSGRRASWGSLEDNGDGTYTIDIRENEISFVPLDLESESLACVNARRI